ncbi:hypothetical protein Tco_0344901, partial [Tanacetum coccineum]
TDSSLEQLHGDMQEAYPQLQTPLVHQVPLDRGLKELKLYNSLQSCMVGEYVAAMSFLKLISPSVLWETSWGVDSALVVERVYLNYLFGSKDPKPITSNTETAVAVPVINEPSSKLTEIVP